MSLTHRSDAGERLLVYTASGPVRGIAAGGIHRFLGIPYAAAPVGMHRFGPPARAPEWVTEFDASTPGPTAPQVPYPGALGRLLPSVRVPGDGYLNLNICVPADPANTCARFWSSFTAAASPAGRMPSRVTMAARSPATD